MTWQGYIAGVLRGRAAHGNGASVRPCQLSIKDIFMQNRLRLGACAMYYVCIIQACFGVHNGII